MPWIINENNQFEYKQPEVPDGTTPLSTAEKKDLAFFQSFLYDYGSKPKEMDNFLVAECLRPISFYHEKEDGSKELKTLSDQETRNWLNAHKKIFSEAGREPATHLMAFAIKNGLSVTDLSLLKDHPDDPRCAAIRQTLEQARQEMFALVSNENTTVRESRMVDFFTSYFLKMSNHLNEIRQSNKTNSEKTLDFINAFKEYHSLTVQSLELGTLVNPNDGRLDFQKLIPSINAKLAENGAAFTFDNLADFGRLSQLITQPGTGLNAVLDDKNYENDLKTYRNTSFSTYTRIAHIMAYLSDNIWNSDKSTDDILKEYTAKKGREMLNSNTLLGASTPGFVRSEEDLQGVMEAEDLQTDLYLDQMLSKFSDQTVSDNFENQLHSLADAFGNQSNPMDPGLHEMTRGLAKLSEVYRNPNSDRTLKLAALRYAQLKAADYIKSHQAEFAKESPKPAMLLAEKVFLLAGVQKQALRAGLAPGSILKGSAEYSTPDLSLENLMSFAPVKIKSEKLKARRYKTIMQKHANSEDVLPNAQRHIQEQTTADYTNINNVTDRKSVVVHSGLGKKQSARGERTLEFVCAGSSNIQLAKTYKGQTGRNEIGQIELKDDQAALEIVDNIKQKYNIHFETAEPGDNSKYEWALEQEYGKPMYLDSNKVLHAQSQPDAKLMTGIRKIEKNGVTRYNISGTMAKIMGFIGDPGFSNSGEHSIGNNKDYMIGLADQWLSEINEEYQAKIQEGKESELKPINIMFKGHSRGGVAANEASLMVNYLVEHKYPQLREYVRISTQLLDPVPGLGSNLKHPTVDMDKGDYQMRGKNLRGLKASSVEKKNNNSTVFYGIHSNNKIGFAPQSVNGADRLILSMMRHDTGIFDAVDGHKRGYLAENGEEYRGSGLDELAQGLYFIDENKNIVACKNSQEAHKAIDAMLGSKAKVSSQWSRHLKVHDMVDAWFKSHPEIITSKDTRYPVEQAMQADKQAMKNVLDSFDNSRPETELTSEPDYILTRAISSLLAHQLLLDSMRDSGKRFFPESVEETNKLLAQHEESGLADKIRNSENFKLFYDSLNKDDIQVLASANPTQLRTYLNNFKAIANIAPEAKRQIRNENLALRSANQVGRKGMFFEKHIGADGEWNPPVPNRINLSAGRTALNMMVVSRLLRQGKKLKDIMDPFKLERERQAMGDKVLHDYLSMSDDKLAETAAKDIMYGFEKSLDEVDAIVGELDSLSVEELSKPENAYILRCRDLITNFGQELGSKGQPVFEKALALNKNGAEKIEKLFKRQVTSNLIMHRLEEAQGLVNDMINHPERFDNPEEALVNVGGAVFTVMGIGTKFKELKAKEKGKFKFTEAFGDINENDIEVCKSTIQTTELFEELKNVIAQKADPEAVDTVQLQKLGRELQSGKLFEGKIKIREDGMGFEPIPDIKDLIKSFNKQLTPKLSERDRQAQEIYENSRHNIALYQKKAREAAKLEARVVPLDEVLNYPSDEPELEQQEPELNQDAELAKESAKDPMEVFLTEKISEALGTAIEPGRLEENLDYFVTHGDDNNRHRMLDGNGNTSRIEQIKSILESGGKVFITIPDKTYGTMDTGEIVIKDGKPTLEIPKLEHDAMTMSVRGLCKRVEAAGDIKDNSPEFAAFKQKLAEIAKNGIPKDSKEYYNTLNDLYLKAFDYGVKNIDQKMTAKQDACVTAASQALEIYRAVCMHEKPSLDGMNLTMIASKFYKSQLAADIKSGRPEAAGKAREILASYDKYSQGVMAIVSSKKFSNLFKNMSSKDLEKFAHKPAADITKSLTAEKCKGDGSFCTFI